MSNVSKRRKEGSRPKIKSMGDHKEFLKRITKTLYYGQLPTLPCLSLPVTEVSCEVWSMGQRGRSLKRLHCDAAARIAHGACVSPCALVLALLYLERLHACNPDYVAAAAPADLFLVSLMVGNKFLQDDGEDDDVMCCEWAASGDLRQQHLKKLEIEFLNAIDWNVFVSEQSFEVGLQRLERRVALKQAQQRGFFTYSDLRAAGDLALPDLLRSVSGACLALTLGYLSSLAAFLTSTLVVSQSWLPVLHFTARTALAPLDANIITHRLQPDVPYVNNATLDTDALDVAEKSVTDALDMTEQVNEQLKCCSKWMQYRDSTESKRSWYDAIVVYNWRALEPWWSTTSVLNWLYQSSLVDPMQRWLEKINEYAEFLGKEFSEPVRDEVCTGHWRKDPRCVRQWMNLSKLGALMAAVSDR